MLDSQGRNLPAKRITKRTKARLAIALERKMNAAASRILAGEHGTYHRAGTRADLCPLCMGGTWATEPLSGSQR